MKGLLLMALLVAMPSVEAAEASQSHKLSWTMATTRTDGSALKLSEITAIDIQYGSKPAATANKAIATVLTTPAVPVLTYAVPTTQPGTYCYQVRTVAGNQKSAWSAEKCAEVLALPNPPSLTVELVLQLSN